MYEVFNKIFKSLDCSLTGYMFFFASLAPAKYTVVYYDNDKTFRFDKLEQLSLISEIFYPEGLDDFLREIDNDRTAAFSGYIFRSSNKNAAGKFNLSIKISSHRACQNY